MDHIPVRGNSIPPPPPPPLPPPHTGPSSPSSPSFRPARLQAQQQRLSPLATHFTAAELAAPFLPANTSINPNAPASAYPVSTPLIAASSSHVGFLASAISSSHRPSGPMASYNPQEWGSSGTVGGAYVSHSTTAERTRARGTRDVSGMEGAI